MKILSVLFLGLTRKSNNGELFNKNWDRKNKDKLAIFFWNLYKFCLKFTFDKLKQNFIDYWFGYVSIVKNYIHCEDGVQRLDSFAIIVGKHRVGQWFSDISPKNIQTLIDNIKNNKNKYFNLYLNLGCSAYQDYKFNKYQQKLLLKELEKLQQEKMYYGKEEQC